MAATTGTHCPGGLAGHGPGSGEEGSGLEPGGPLAGCRPGAPDTGHADLPITGDTVKSVNSE